ncbi:MAG TPA: hypothetical protein VFU48_14175 [Nitrospira sp.]|nr:hypothetical protein [Nitrospira sp.]
MFLYHLMHARKWESIAPKWEYGKKPAICWLHHAGESADARLVLDRFGYLPALHSVIQEDVHRLSPKGHVFVLPWPSFSSWEWPPSQPNPYHGGKPVVLFCGTLRPHSVEMLGALQSELPDCEVHVISCNIYDASRRGELKGNRDGLFMIEELPKGCVYHSPMAHSTFSQFYWYADVGIDIAASNGQRVANTKLMDYLAAGLPIVSSGFAPGMEIAQQLGRIKIAEFGDVNQMATLVRDTLAAGRQESLRQLSREFIAAHCSSNSVADTLATLFENHR